MAFMDAESCAGLHAEGNITGLIAFTHSESCASLHAECNIAGSADLNRLISQSTANSHSPKFLLVQNTGSVTLNGEVLHRAPVLTRPCPEL
ncbi:unnamed protein product [Schistocephalus solidus]|uniref:Dispersed gene family protein 1 (DGF-1) n=1 Tax=Schistocephalus solidus TaxID=70667 RepID=A0A183TF95_SCHSO|nr:unnamed protein product [Schistocephalus solidus]